MTPEDVEKLLPLLDSDNLEEAYWNFNRFIELFPEHEALVKPHIPIVVTREPMTAEQLALISVGSVVIKWSDGPIHHD